MHIHRNSIVFLLAVAFLLPACSTVNTHYPSTVHQPAPGPPAHAPAHGYRKKHAHDNVELIYDSPSGVYVVVGYEGHFFTDNIYYRIAGDNWEISASIGGPWTVTSHTKVPYGVKKHKHKSKKGKGKSKGKGKGKGRGQGRGY